MRETNQRKLLHQGVFSDADMGKTRDQGSKSHTKCDELCPGVGTAAFGNNYHKGYAIVNHVLARKPAHCELVHLNMEPRILLFRAALMLDFPKTSPHEPIDHHFSRGCPRQ